MFPAAGMWSTHHHSQFGLFCCQASDESYSATALSVNSRLLSLAVLHWEKEVGMDGLDAACRGIHPQN